MSVAERHEARQRNTPEGKRTRAKPISLKARPCESIDYKALAADVRKRYPKILARLAE